MALAYGPTGVRHISARTISALSTDYDRWAVTAPSTPTGDAVQFAYLPVGSNPPVVSDWTAGVWEATQLSTGEWVADCLLGPGVGGKVLAVGEYIVWLKITDSPVIPVLQPGTITVQ